MARDEKRFLDAREWMCFMGTCPKLCKALEDLFRIEELWNDHVKKYGNPILLDEKEITEDDKKSYEKIRKIKEFMVQTGILYREMGLDKEIEHEC